MEKRFRRIVAGVSAAALAVTTMLSNVWVEGTKDYDKLPLGYASDYMIFVENDYELSENKDIEGKIAVGGYLKPHSDWYAVGTHYTTGETVAVIGGGFTKTLALNGRKALVSQTAYDGAPENNKADLIVQEFPFDFSTEFANFRKYSSFLAQKGIDNAYIAQYGKITFTGSNQKINIFNITITDFNSISHGELEIIVPENSYAVINFIGTESLDLQFNTVKFNNNSDAQGLNALSERILYNIPNSQQVTSNGRKGTILAPNSHVIGNDGHIEGQVIAKSYYGSSEIGQVLFGGQPVLPTIPDGTNPETPAVTTPAVTTPAETTAAETTPAETTAPATTAPETKAPEISTAQTPKVTFVDIDPETEETTSETSKTIASEAENGGDSGLAENEYETDANGNPIRPDETDTNGGNGVDGSSENPETGIENLIVLPIMLGAAATAFALSKKRKNSSK